MKMQLTGPQYEILAAAAKRGDNVISRGEGISDATLRSLAKRNIGTLVTEGFTVTGLYVTTTGWLIFTEESDRRAMAAQVEANARPRRQDSDPFAAYATSPDAVLDAKLAAAFAV